MRFTDDVWNLVDEALLAYDRHLRNGGEPDVTAFLPDAASPARMAVLVELIKLEQEYCLDRGAEFRLEAYLEAYPQLGRDLAIVAELLRAECRARVYRGESVEPEELKSRFPQVFEQFGIETLFPIARDESTDSVAVEVDNQLLESLRTGQWFDEPENLPRPLAPDTSLGRYTILSVLGRGGMATVYLAQDEELDRVVAIKMLHERFLAQDEDLRDMLRRDARAAARLRHPGVVPVYDISVDDSGRPFIVMEYVKGESLQRRLQRGPLSIDDAVEIAIQVASVLAAAHRSGLIHRDIKPGNILLDENDHARVTDFGLAIKLEELETMQHECSGTLPYMSPEQIAGDVGIQGERTDIWALGVVLYEMLTGQRPFQGADRAEIGERILQQPIRPPRELNREIPARLQAICLRALERNIDDRLPSAEQMHAELVAVRDQRRGVSRRSVLVLGGSGLILGAAAGVYAWFNRPAPPWAAPQRDIGEVVTHPYLRDCGLVWAMDTGAQIDLSQAHRYILSQAQGLIPPSTLRFDTARREDVVQSIERSKEWIRFEVPLTFYYSPEYVANKNHNSISETEALIGPPDTTLRVRVALSADGVFQYGTVAQRQDEHLLVMSGFSGIANHDSFAELRLPVAQVGPPQDAMTESGVFQNRLAEWFLWLYRGLENNEIARVGPRNGHEVRQCPTEIRNYLGVPITVIAACLYHQRYGYSEPAPDRLALHEAYNQRWSPIAEDPDQDVELMFRVGLDSPRSTASFLAVSLAGDQQTESSFLVEGLTWNDEPLFEQASSLGPEFARVTPDRDAGTCDGYARSNNGVRLLLFHQSPTAITLRARSRKSVVTPGWVWATCGRARVRSIDVAPRPKDGRRIEPLVSVYEPTPR